jgi:hypothetical protein
MTGACMTCGRAGCKIEWHHPAARVRGIPQTATTTPLCVPCHVIVTRWQNERWRRRGPLPAQFESWYGWSDLMRLSALRAGTGSTRGWSRAERSLWRNFSGAGLAKPWSTSPPLIEVTATAGACGTALRDLVFTDAVNLYRPWLALAVASDTGYGCWTTFVNDDGTVVNYPDVRPDTEDPGPAGTAPVSSLVVLRLLLGGWPQRLLGEIELIEL